MSVKQRFLQHSAVLTQLCCSSTFPHFPVCRSFGTVQRPQRPSNPGISKKSKYAHLLDATRSPSDILQNLSSEDQQRMKDLQTRIPYLTTKQSRMPTLEMLSDKHWLQLLTLDSDSSMLRYLRFVFLTHINKENEKKKHEKRKQINLELSKSKNLDMVNTVILEMITNTRISAFYNQALLHAFLFNLPLIIDMDFQDVMNHKEQKFMCNQIREIHASNRISPEPFHLHFTGLDFKSFMYSEMSQIFLQKRTYEISEGDDKMEDKIPYTFTDKCFTEIFPKEKLVYLTPHTDRQLEQFDPNDIYVIGALNDTTQAYPATRIKSRKLGIRLRSLPLEREFRFWQGRKSLCANQVFDIMSSLFLTGSDWKEAMKFIPSRFTTPEGHTDNTKHKFGEKPHQQN